jgi:hypothetical protein
VAEDPRTTDDALAGAVVERARRVAEAAQRAAADARAAAERDAERIREQAEAEAAAALEEARRRVDAFAEGRIRRIREAGDALIVAADELAQRTRQSARLQRGIEDVVGALAAAAEAIAAEAGRPIVRLPGTGDRRPGDAPSEVRRVARELPRRPGD